MPQGKPEVSEDLGSAIRSEIAEALQISVTDLCNEYPIAIASTGHSKVMVPICSNELLYNVKPDM
jgi:predicted PhzF superfamily epimerase YddE/YHI9